MSTTMVSRSFLLTAFVVGVSAQTAKTNTAIILSGAGTTNPQNYFRTVMEYMTVESKLSTRAVYRAVGSSTGYKEFIGAGKDAALVNDKFVDESNNPITTKLTPLNDFGAGDIPIAKSYYAAAKANDPDRKIMQIPLFLGAIAIFYHNDNGKVSKLNLDGCVLVEIFSGKLKKWDDDKIKNLNPGATLPSGDIVVVHRRFGSSSTSGTTSYLNQVGKDLKCATQWPATMNGGKSVSSTVGKDGKWFADGSDVAAQGSSGVLAALRETPGSIGYIDAGHGRNQAGLGEVSLKNAAGEYVTSSDLATSKGLELVAEYAVAKNVFKSDYTDDWSDVALLNLGGNDDYDAVKRKKFWPITMVTYLYVNPDQSKSDPEWYGFWKFFVDYVTTSAEGQGLATHSEFGFTKLPPSVIEKTKAQIGQHFKAPAGAKTWIQEKASATQAYVGAGDYVISGKRKSNAFAKRSALAAALGKNFGTKDTVVELGLITELKNLKTEIEALNAKLNALTGNVDENTAAIKEGARGVNHAVHARTFDFETTLALLLTTAAMWTALMR